ncbi:MAG: hypothetical protein ACP5HQ_03345 [Thermoprotei archaeon]
MNVPFQDYERVYEELGGIPGWLTYFGFTYSQTRDLGRSLEETLRYARTLITREFENFLKGREGARERYLAVMRTVSDGCASWGRIKRALEAMEGVSVGDSQVYNYLQHLLEASWIAKVGDAYCPSEPLIGRAFGEP